MKNSDEQENAYNFGVQPRGVCALNDGVVKIIRITLALVLQLVEEVEDVKSEDRRGAFNRRRKPAGAKELDMFGNAGTAITVADDEAVGARQVENQEVVKRRGVGARATNVLSELNDEANGGEGTAFEVAAIPFLGLVSNSRP